VIPSACAVPHVSGPEVAALFKKHGANKAEYIFIDGLEIIKYS